MSRRGCYLPLQYIIFQYIEYKMQREDDALLHVECLQKIFEFDVVRQEGQLTDGLRLYQE